MSNLSKHGIVAGIGNTIAADDGIGLYLAAYAQKKLARNYPQVQFIALEVDPFALFSYLAGKKWLLLIDAATMGLQSGECRFFTFSDNLFTNNRRYGLHGFDMGTVLALTVRLYPHIKIFILGIEPETVTAGKPITDTLTRNSLHYIQCMKNHIDFLLEDE